MNPNIIEKIQKLQALADNAGTEHEAALAAQRVAELCRQHNLDIGIATLTAEETEATESRHVHDSSRWQAHWSWLGQACDALFGVAHYKTAVAQAIKNQAGFVTGRQVGAAIVFYGLKASVQSAIMTYEYLTASVEAMLEGYINGGGQCFGLTDRRSFRIGCAERISEEAEKVGGESRKQVAANEDCQALVRLEGRLIKAHAAKLHLCAGHGARGAASHSAYSAGYAAGGRVDIHGARSSRMLR